MQSTRFLAAANMLRPQPTTLGLVRARFMNPSMRVQRSFQTAGKRMSPMPKEEHAAHTVSQRLRSLKRIPPELIPIGVVLAVALFAAGYSIIRKFYTDTTLRLHRQGPSHNK